MNEFNSEDVVVHPKNGRGIVQDEVIEWGAHEDYSILSEVAPDLRRLAVIDPEDRGQVERLLLAYGVVDSPDNLLRCIPKMQAALREVANPKPPCIEEPGTWGVVEASCAHNDSRKAWVKYPDGNWWPTHQGLPDDWDSLVDPVLIREGVQS